MCYPVAESITNGLLMSTGNLFGIILTLSLSGVIQVWDNEGVWISFGCLIVVALAAFILSFFIHEDLKRQEDEKRRDSVTLSTRPTHVSYLSCEETGRDDNSQIRYPTSFENNTDSIKLIY